MKRIGVSYVSWFNRNYDRCGHLFQDRFKSEAIESDEYFLTVLRYIHQNPMKMGQRVTYRWSSYSEYLGEHRLVDTDFALGIFSPEPIRCFKKYMHEKAEDIGILVYKPNKLSDEEAKEAIQETAGITMPAELQKMEKANGMRYYGR